MYSEGNDCIEQQVEGGDIMLYHQQLYSTTTLQRIDELQKQLDDLVVAQNQMRRIIEVLSTRVSTSKIKSTPH